LIDRRFRLDQGARKIGVELCRSRSRRRRSRTPPLPHACPSTPRPVAEERTRAHARSAAVDPHANPIPVGPFTSTGTPSSAGRSRQPCGRRAMPSSSRECAIHLSASASTIAVSAVNTRAGAHPSRARAHHGEVSGADEEMSWLVHERTQPRRTRVRHSAAQRVGVGVVERRPRCLSRPPTTVRAPARLERRDDSSAGRRT